MLGPARTSEHRLGALIRPTLQFGDRDEAELAPLAETNSSADDILGRIERGEEPWLEARPARRPDPTPAEDAARADEPTSAPTRTRKPRTPQQQGAVELLQHAIAGYEKAINASA
jgi:hypothetical protein